MERLKINIFTFILKAYDYDYYSLLQAIIFTSPQQSVIYVGATYLKLCIIKCIGLLYIWLLSSYANPYEVCIQIYRGREGLNLAWMVVIMF